MTNYAANISIFSKELLYVEQGGGGRGVSNSNPDLNGLLQSSFIVHK